MGRKKKEKPAGSGQIVDKPQDWDIAVSVAYLRAIGHTQEEAAKGAGCSIRTVRSWERSPFWPQAWEEAKQRWLKGVVAMTRRGLLTALNDSSEYAQTARWAAERLFPVFYPPRQKIQNEISGRDGDPIEHTIGRVVIMHADNKRDKK